MGKGDQRTKRGKIFRGTYGNTRRRKKGQEAPKPERAPTPRGQRPTPAG